MQKVTPVDFSSSFLQSFEGKNTRVPVWLMRQAGRYLPEYQALKKKYSFLKMLKTPEIAAEVTCQPLRRFPFDAAILFQDILTLPLAMGFHIDFVNGVGPVVRNPLRGIESLKKIHRFEDLSHVTKTIQLIRKEIPQTALLGFAGSPFTILVYLIEGGSTKNFSRVFRWMVEDPQGFHQLLDLFTRETIRYLNLQKEAGIHAFQLFDTWGGVLSPKLYAQFVLPYVQKIFKALKHPSIYFLKNTAPFLSLIEGCGADFISLCHSVDLEDPLLRKTKMGVQGNLWNAALFSDEKTLGRSIDTLLQKARHYPRYLFNLSHGLLPETPLERVDFLVRRVHAFRWV
jgi:uroporphyrinogen decarboxylase